MGLISSSSKQKEGDRPVVSSALTGLRAEMDRLLDSFFREPLSALEGRFGGQRAWSPPLDIAEDNEEVTVRAEVPGVAPEDLEITVSGGQLVLAGEKKESSEQEGKDFFHTEIRYGSFRRSVPLPDTVDPHKVEASYSNGVLIVHLKKSPSAPPKKVEVKVQQRPEQVSGE